ncbi:sensor histidine kinase [Thermoactinomyces mirandus]|uniref:histidine kinase n=1 Tax=Thermoactinomyces mirandus TaxID=2756294 RepID=A0A7W2AQ79_9BACL|nr:HAMP domain-containing sensor histidine kinase [Thermoactinomyces mirandus]MBA4601012.1 HAMP domain-containing histidine kinase [Thermoactinomyces mirandus]
MNFLLVYSMFCTIIIIVLFMQINHINNKLKVIGKLVDEVRSGNFNVRFHLLPTMNRHIAGTSRKLNELMVYLQEMNERRAFLEEERKKMISNISHDLRTPLTSVMGYLEEILSGSVKSEKEKMEYVKVTYQKSIRLHSLLESFFELSKIEAQDIKVELKEVELVSLAEECILSFYHDFTRENLKVEINLPRDPVVVLGDRKSLERILYNLFSNALRYGKDGGVIGLTMTESGDEVTLEVWDRGQGIRKQDMPYIFRRLYTGDRSRNTMHKGSGLGLTITRKLVELNQGSIEVSSIPFEKTTFRVVLRKFVRNN